MEQVRDMSGLPGVMMELWNRFERGSLSKKQLQALLEHENPNDVELGESKPLDFGNFLGPMKECMSQLADRVLSIRQLQAWLNETDPFTSYLVTDQRWQHVYWKLLGKAVYPGKISGFDCSDPYSFIFIPQGLSLSDLRKMFEAKKVNFTLNMGRGNEASVKDEPHCLGDYWARIFDSNPNVDDVPTTDECQEPTGLSLRECLLLILGRSDNGRREMHNNDGIYKMLNVPCPGTRNGQSQIPVVRSCPRAEGSRGGQDSVTVNWVDLSEAVHYVPRAVSFAPTSA